MEVDEAPGLDDPEQEQEEERRDEGELDHRLPQATGAHRTVAVPPHGATSMSVIAMAGARPMNVRGRTGLKATARNGEACGTFFACM